jgi:hypothetical protein
MNECNVIKYVAYRTAAKLRVLQRALHSEFLKIVIVQGDRIDETNKQLSLEKTASVYY